MRRPFIVFLMLFAFIYGCKQHGNAVKKSNLHKGYDVDIVVPTEWIDKVRAFNYKPTDTSLLQQFETIIKPDTITNPHWEHVSKVYGKVFDPIFVDLDGEPGEELICLLGWDVTCPDLCVFKQIKGTWHLLYMEPIDTFYSGPTLAVANNYSKNKAFYYRHVLDHGSGIYEDSYSFYKLINSKVYHCLELVNEAHIYGWGMFINQEVTMSFEFSGDSDDGLGVTYNYNFFPGAIKTDDCPWCADPDVPLIHGSGSVSYVWDNKKMIYKLNIPDYKTSLEDLTAAKISCFGAFGNDTLFVKAFNDQIQDKIRSGTPQQKKILANYLKIVEKDKKSRTAELKVTTQIGGTTFYGQKQK